MTNKKISFKEATKNMSIDEVDIYRQQLSRQSFNDAMSKRDSRGDLIVNLHTILFSEANDFFYDSRSDKKDRDKGINPMNQEYTNEMNHKRISLGVTPLNQGGTECDSSTMSLCEDIATRLNDDEIKNLIVELTKKTTSEMIDHNR